jgi:hypothetical protein
MYFKKKKNEEVGIVRRLYVLEYLHREVSLCLFFRGLNALFAIGSLR